MGTLNRDNIKAILKPFKEKIDNLVDKDNASVNNTISINNNGTIATLSAEQDSVKLSIGDNTMALNTDGELLVNNTNILSNNSNTLEYDEMTIDSPYTKNADIPYEFYRGSAVAIGNDIYLLGSYNDKNNMTNNYKYNIAANTYIKMRDIPYYFHNGSAVNINNDIYLFGSAYEDSNHTYIYANYNYKYDIITDTYTKMTDISYKFYNGSVVAIGNDIYLLGGTWGGYNNYKYDIITDTYNKNKDIPYYFYHGSAVNINNDIYLFGSTFESSSNTYLYSKYNYKYDSTTDTYSKNTNIPYEFYNASAVAIGNDIYLLGSDADGNTACYNYKYDITANTYTKNTNIPHIFHHCSATAIGNNIYLLGGYSGFKTNNYKYNISDYSGKIKFKKSDHYIYTDRLKYYDSNKSQVIYLDDDELYVEYDKNNNLIKNNFTPDVDGKMNIYVRTGSKLNGKSLPGSGWQTINILEYM